MKPLATLLKVRRSGRLLGTEAVSILTKDDNRTAIKSLGKKKKFAKEIILTFWVPT